MFKTITKFIKAKSLLVCTQLNIKPLYIGPQKHKLIDFNIKTATPSLLLRSNTSLLPPATNCIT